MVNLDKGLVAFGVEVFEEGPDEEEGGDEVGLDGLFNIKPLPPPKV